MKSDLADVELPFINGTKKTADNAMTGHSLEDMEKFSSGGKSWRNAWVDFTQNTTLHGLRYICRPGSIFRR